MLHSHVQFELNGFDSGDKIKDFVRNFLSDQDVFKSVSNSLQGKATFVNSDKTLRYVSYRSGDKGMQWILSDIVQEKHLKEVFVFF